MSEDQERNRVEAERDLERMLLERIRAIHREAQRQAAPLVDVLIGLQSIRPRPMALTVTDLSEAMRDSMIQQMQAKG